MYRKLQKIAAAMVKLSDLNKGMSHAVNTQTHWFNVQNRRLDALTGKLATVSEFKGGVEANLYKFSAHLGGNCPLFGFLFYLGYH